MELGKIVNIVLWATISLVALNMVSSEVSGDMAYDSEQINLDRYSFVDSYCAKESVMAFFDDSSEKKQLVMDRDSFLETDLCETFNYFMDPDSDYYIISKEGGCLQIEEIRLSESQNLISVLQALDQSNSYIVTEGNFSPLTFVKTDYVDCGSDGSYAVRTRIQYIEEDILRYNYYAIVHEIITMPGTNRYVEQVICNAEPTNLLGATYRFIDSYQPTGTDFSSRITLSYGAGLSGSGASLESSISWSMDIPSIVIEDYSGLNNVSLIFNFGYKSFESSQTRTQTLGYFVVVDCDSSPFKTGNLMGNLDVEVKFIEERTWWIFPYDVRASYSSTHSYNCTANPVTITYDGAGSDCNDMFFDDPEFYLDDSYSMTYGQGDYLTLHTTGFVKIGYTAVGYSLVENSDHVDYQFGTEIRAVNSMTLYVVWREN